MNKPNKAQIEEWKKKHGGIFMLESEGLTAYVFDPTNDLRIMKMLFAAMQKGSIDLVDAFIANCWIAGDEEIKSDQCKLGLTSSITELVDIPEHETIYEGDKAIILVDGEKAIEVRLATRQDIKYAEDRNKGDKPLDTQVYLLERIAIDKAKLDDLRKNVRKYLACLLAVNELKEKKYVSVKKL